MKVHQKYQVVFDTITKNQISYFEEATNVVLNENEVLKVIQFNPETTLCSLDENDNIILNIKKSEDFQIDNKLPPLSKQSPDFLVKTTAFLIGSGLINLKNRTKSETEIITDINKKLGCDVVKTFEELELFS